MLANLILRLEAVVAAGIASLELGINAVGHRLEVLAKLVEGIEEAVALHIRPAGLAIAGLQLRRRLLSGLLLLLAVLPLAGRRRHRPSLVLFHLLDNTGAGPRPGAVVRGHRA